MQKNKNKHRHNNSPQRRIYVVGSGAGYANWMQGKIIHNMEEADLVVFTGGEDVSPSLYNQPEHYTTSASLYRDKYELAQYERATKLNKHKIGICRGLQFLTAMSGGILIQDQQNPRMYHPIETNTGEKYVVSSLHHQAAYPWNMPQEDYKILGWANGESIYHKGGNNEELEPQNGQEVEVIYFPKTKSYGIQGHPEMMFDDKHPECKRTIHFFQNQLTNFLNDKL